LVTSQYQPRLSSVTGLGQNPPDKKPPNNDEK
jgi:hypothetical protein